jgi:hypothetical protein
MQLERKEKKEKMLKKIVSGMILILLLSSIFAVYYTPTANADYNSYAPPPDSKLSMATSSDGYLYVVYDDWWSSTSSYILWLYRSADQGLTWTFFGRWYDTLYGKNISNPSMAIDPYDNMIYVAYEYEYSPTDHDVYCLVVDPATMSFNAHIVDYSTWDTRYPSITCEYEFGAFAGGNYQYISFEHIVNYDDRDLMYANSSGSKGTTWSTWTIEGASDANVYTQSCITNAQGYIYIACREATDYGSVGTIRVERKSWADPPTTWTAFQNVSGLTNNCAYPTIAASHGGDTVVEAHQYDYYSAYHNLDADIWYSYSSDFGNTWSKSHALFATSANETAPVLTVDGGGSTATDVRGRFHLVCRVGNWGDPSQYVAYTNVYYGTPTAWSTPVRALATSIISIRAVSGVYNYNLAITTQYRVGEGKFHPCIAWAELAIIRFSALWQITYNYATNIITVVGGTSVYPVCFTDIWMADKAGWVPLQTSRGVTGTDGSPVALTYNLRPTDYYVLGGPVAYNLGISVTTWTSMTSSTIRLIGTDPSGYAQTEDIAVIGTGGYYATKYFHTLTSSQVIAFSGSGGYYYSVSQGQWGVVWKTGVSEFAFDAKLYIGDGSSATYFADKDKMVVFNTGIATASYQSIFYGAAGSTITLGQLDDAAAKSTSHGCVIQMLEASYYNSQFWGAGTLCLYSCTLMGYWNGAILGQPILYGLTATSKVYNCLFDCFTLQTALPGSEVNNLIVTGGKYAVTACRGTMNDIRCSTQDYALYVTTNYATSISNVVVRDATIASIYANAITTDKYLINVDADAWTFQWAGTSTAKIYRQYTFDLKVTDKANNNLSGANVTLKDKNSNTVFSVLTDASGNIATQTVSRGFYNQTYLSTLQDLSPHTLTITKTGYTAFTQVFTLTGKTSWQISLSP